MGWRWAEWEGVGGCRFLWMGRGEGREIGG